MNEFVSSFWLAASIVYTAQWVSIEPNRVLVMSGIVKHAKNHSGKTHAHEHSNKLNERAKQHIEHSAST